MLRRPRRAALDNAPPTQPPKKIALLARRRRAVGFPRDVLGLMFSDGDGGGADGGGGGVLRSPTPPARPLSCTNAQRAKRGAENKNIQNRQRA